MTTDDPDAYLGLSEESAETSDSNWFRDIRNAAIILTGWSLGRRGDISGADTANSRRAFVIIGFALGVAAALVAWIADGLGLYAFGAAVFAAVAVMSLTNARAESGLASAAADLAGADSGSDRRVALVSSSIAMILLTRVAALTALAPLSTMLAAYLAALVLSSSAMALATLAGQESDDEPLFSSDGSGALWISGIAAILLAIVFVGFWTALLAAFVSVLVGAWVWAWSGLLGLRRSRNLLYVIRIKVELAVILTVVAVN